MTDYARPYTSQDVNGVIGNAEDLGDTPMFMERRVMATAKALEAERAAHKAMKAKLENVGISLERTQRERDAALADLEATRAELAAVQQADRLGPLLKLQQETLASLGAAAQEVRLQKAHVARLREALGHHCKGTRTRPCTMCGDSTFDHECNDREVPCPTCGTVLADTSPEVKR